MALTPKEASQANQHPYACSAEADIIAHPLLQAAADKGCCECAKIDATIEDCEALMRVVQCEGVLVRLQIC